MRVFVEINLHIQTNGPFSRNPGNILSLPYSYSQKEYIKAMENNEWEERESVQINIDFLK